MTVRLTFGPVVAYERKLSSSCRKMEIMAPVITRTSTVAAVNGSGKSYLRCVAQVSRL